jgi:hypothetical protein
MKVRLVAVGIVGLGAGAPARLADHVVLAEPEQLGTPGMLFSVTFRLPVTAEVAGKVPESVNETAPGAVLVTVIVNALLLIARVAEVVVVKSAVQPAPVIVPPRDTEPTEPLETVNEITWPCPVVPLQLPSN